MIHPTKIDKYLMIEAIVWICMSKNERGDDEWNVDGMITSESQSSGEPWSFDIVMNVLLFNGFFDDFPGAEWDVSGGIKIGWFGLEGSESDSGSLDLT